ncbi:hypothetical protein E4L95_22275 [Paracoccus liaowanqingii]|uniref:Uncharacterized protein n=1 Tax=Paracoccus liaowanqingii TaxID=2560053 RepID=A0A4P7HIL7_9RHOB|nr:hypothetical protein [Paracoccus liaowanqingii]QBX33934.1 hypothetical protein E4191_03825 [Paracoccus liaowanqingii]TGN37704.1 hypothetical protein E4L95_22275 [Paracoccus liaowanqingii]
MLELIIIACLHGQCREFSNLYDPAEVSMLTCMMSGQTEVARWQQAHAGWQVKRWRCGIHSRQEARL